MRLRAVVFAWLWVAAIANARPCAPLAQGGGIVAAREPDGYSISVNRSYAYWPRAPKGTSIASAAQFLAREAGVALFLFSDGIAKPVAGVMNRPTAEEALRAFLESAGLRLVVRHGTWLVLSSDEPLRDLDFAVFASRLDTPLLREGIEANDAMEAAILRALPSWVGAYDGPVRLGISYMPIVDEASGTYLVVRSRSMAMASPVGRMLEAFKVRVTGDGRDHDVECVWGQVAGGRGESVFGPPVQIAEDFDGDGVRDFVFMSNDAQEGPDVVLSGKDGHRMASFLSATIAVEHVRRGPKRIAVNKLWEELAGARVLELDLVSKRFEPREIDAGRRARILSERAGARGGAGSEARGEAQVRGRQDAGAGNEFATGELLRQRLGSGARISVYFLRGTPGERPAGVELVEVASVPWNPLAMTDARAGSVVRTLLSVREVAEGDTGRRLEFGGVWAR